MIFRRRGNGGDTATEQCTTPPPTEAPTDSACVDGSAANRQPMSVVRLP
jgi:hypothetical protein